MLIMDHAIEVADQHPPNHEESNNIFSEACHVFQTSPIYNMAVPTVSSQFILKPSWRLSLGSQLLTWNPE